MPRPFLLDVNVLIALFDSAHVHHQTAHAWWAEKHATGWRTCPVTESGLLRILSNPAYPNGGLSIADISLRLEEFKDASEHYKFWHDDFSLSYWLKEAEYPIASSNLTDAYLLKLSAQHTGTLATLDRRIRPSLIGENDLKIVEHIAS